MRKKLTNLRMNLWIVCFAVLVNTLAPSVFQALSTARGDSMAWSICTTKSAENVNRARTRLSALSTVRFKNSNENSNEKSKANIAMDCANCLPHPDAGALIFIANDGLGLFTGYELRPVLVYQSPQPLQILSAASPRGPPADFA